MPHTHWDREWYRPFQSFRMQLVDLVDRVLEMLEADPEFAFTLDGQLATIDDYLEIRPEQQQRIAQHVASGRLAIGPWQILMDEFLVSGETLVRNLEMGWSRATEFGEPMRAGYLPDMFGHVAQMPQILRAAGLSDAVVWRGVPAAIDRHAFRWESPDGSWVRAEYLADGYGNAAGMFAVPERLDAAAGRFVEWARPWFGTDPVLAMYGTDHAAPIPELAALVGRLNEVHEASRMEISTLAGYLEAAPPLSVESPCWRGEMRSGARANVLMGVASARIDIKQAAGRAETLLERYAEPLTALHVAADAWPAAFLRLAWRRVVENSAHDSICGCSVDPVVDQVLVRFAEAQQIASTLTRRASATLAASVPRAALTIVNPSPMPRAGLVIAELPVPDDWNEVSLELPDGSRIATQELERKEPILLDEEVRGSDVDSLFKRFHGREIFDHAWNAYAVDGRTITFEVDSDPDPAWLDVDSLRAEVAAIMRSKPDETWRVRIMARPRRTLAASVPTPPLGWTAVRAAEVRGELADPVRVARDGRTMTNGRLSVVVADDGTLTLTAADGTSAAGLGRIVDGGDFGDSYNYAPPASDRIVELPASVSVSPGLHGPIRGRLVIGRRYEWPAATLADGSARAADTEPVDVVTEVELRAGEPFVRVGIAFDNRSEDHRVRFHVPLPRDAETTQAEGQFAVVERAMSGEGGYREVPLGTYPAHGWVDAGGLAVLLDHLTEYELTDAPGTRGAPGAPARRELAITLLRSIGLISRNDNPYRHDPAGPEMATPNAQMRGRWRIGFALYPHLGSWDSGGVVAAAERYRHDLVSWPGSAAPDASWPPAGADEPTLALEGDGVVLSSLRRRAGGWIEARIVNLAPEPRAATLRGGIVEALEADLHGNAGDPLTPRDGALEMVLGAAQIRTLQFRRHETAVAGAANLDAAGPRQIA